MDPYRGPRAVEALPPLPLHGVARPLLAFSGAAILLAVAGLLVSGSLHATPRHATPTPGAGSRAAQRINLRDGDLDALGEGQVIVTGVVRERRHDTFGEPYVELGKSTRWERQVLQCYFEDEGAWTPPRGARARFRGRYVGRSLGVAVQLEDCVLEADLGDVRDAL